MIIRMNFIDTHAHIYVDKMLENKTEILERAKSEKISKILMPNIDKASIPAMLSLYEENPNFCYPMLGLHPVDVKDNYKTELEEIFAQFSEDYIAIGEIGLDLYWDKTTLSNQIEAFKYQIEFAIEQAEQLISLGFYLGIGGVLTFKNAGVDKTIAKIGLEHLILETDSPYLAPTPYRGKPNEPSYLIKIAQKLSEIKNTSLEEVATQTTANAQKLFNL